MQNLKNKAKIEAEKYVTKFLLERKKNEKTKQNEEQYIHDSLSHSTTCHNQA